MEGYSKIARLMGQHPEFAILRQFRILNLQNLLYLQAEISHLEVELRDMAAHDKYQHDYMKDWWSLSQSPDDNDHLQWAKVIEIRQKLDEYNDALLKQRKMSQMSAVRKQSLDFLRDWFERPSMGAFPLIGLDRTSWDDEHEADLVMVGAQRSKDPFYRWFEQRVVPFIHRKIGERWKQTTLHDLGSGLYEYEERSLSMIVFAATAIVAAIIPLSSVLLLYMVQSRNLKLGIIVVLSVLFSLALSFMTDARKIEVFAATSAFAAVNVVWASGDGICAGQAQ